MKVGQIVNVHVPRIVEIIGGQIAGTAEIIETNVEVEFNIPNVHRVKMVDIVHPSFVRQADGIFTINEEYLSVVEESDS